jgi:hypothetical protein
MTSQEIIERDVRMLIGDLHLQLVMARAQMQELQEKVAQLEQADAVPGGAPVPKANGYGKEAQQ